MGNNYCKALGIVPGHPIHLSQFDQLWRQFDPKNRGYLSKSDANNFLKEFAKATDTKYTSIKAGTIIDDLLGPDGNMGKLAFERLFLAMALEQKVMMSQSLQEELEFADGAAHDGLDSCRRGHTLSVTVPYEGRGWVCDLCRLPGTGAANHCPKCGFDLCDRCRSGPKPHAAELNRPCMLSFLQTLQSKRKEVPIESLVGAHRSEVPPAVSAVVGVRSAADPSSSGRPPMTEAAATLLVTFAELVDANYQVDTVGGKALKLAQVASAFRSSTIFSVPSGAAITTRAYSKHIAQFDAQLIHAIWSRGDLSLLGPLRDAIEERPIDSDTREAIAAFLKTLPADTTLAVRSSATAEDAADFSMAGLAETYLHIPNNIDQVCKHVRKCWTSLWQERVVSYISRAAASSSTPASAPRMCVVLQQMVSASAAGVLFTLHPNTGNEERMFIEAVYGLGEGVVSGDINPTAYDGSWVTRHYTVKHTPQKKKYVRTPGSFGTTVVSTSEAEQKQPPLSKPAVEKLLQMASAADAKLHFSLIILLGVCVASHYGAPQDIEWALDADGKLFLTQTRPITEYSLNLDVGDDSWYPGFQEKTWLCVSMATMTGFASVVKAFAPKFQGDVVRLFFGQAYASSHADGMFNAALRSVSIARSLPARAKQILAFCKHSQNQIEPTMWGLVGQLQSLSDAELSQLVHTLLSEMTEADFNSFLCGTLASNYLGTVQSWLRTMESRGVRNVSVDSLITGAHPNTGGAARMIREIAFAASQHPEARVFVQQTPTAQFINQLSQRKDLEWLWADFSKFLRTYFWMCDIDEEIDSVHWLDDPSLPIESLRAELAKNKFEL